MIRWSLGQPDSSRVQRGFLGLLRVRFCLLVCFVTCDMAVCDLLSMFVIEKFLLGGVCWSIGVLKSAVMIPTSGGQG
jgi:hypothetical protein